MMKQVKENDDSSSKEDKENDVKFSKTMFENTLRILKKKNGSKYDFVLKAGPSLHSALFKLYETVWEKESKPDKWRDTLVIQLYKPK